MTDPNPTPAGRATARFWPLLLFVFAPVIPLWRAILGGQTLGPFEQIAQMHPWNRPKPALPWDVLQADAVLQFFPWRDLVLTSWAQGVPPYWNPYQFAGAPLLANSQSAGFYPPHILLGLLQVPTAIAITLLAWFHLTWAACGVYVLVRNLGGGRVGGAVGGASFATSAFMLAWTPLSSVIATMAWIPWALAAVAAAFGGRGRWTLPGLAASVAMMLLAGHLQFAAYGLMAVGLFALGLSATHRQWKPIAVCLVAVAAGAMLAGPQLLPVLDFSKSSHRRNVASEEGYAAYLGSAMTPRDFVARLANPFAQGDPVEPYGPEGLSTFWPALAKPGANFAESASTFGPIVLLLLCLLPLAGVAWRRAGPLAAVGVVGVLLGLGTPLNRLLYFYAPGWSSTGSPSRILGLGVLVACVMAGLALDSKLTQAPKRSLGIAAGVFAFLFALSLLPTSAPAPQGIPADAWSSLVATGNLPGMAVPVGLVLAMLAVAAWVRPGPSWAKGLVVATPLLFAAAAFANLVRTGDSSFLKPDPAAGYDRVASINGPWSLVTAAPASMPPNTASALRLHDLAGYDSLQHKDTRAILERVSGEDPAPAANGNITFVKPTADPAALAAAGVSRVVTSRTFPDLPPGPGRVDLTGGTARIVEESLAHIAIEVSGGGQLTLRDRHLPGWSASIDGRPVAIEPGEWRVLKVPTGARTVVMRYTPPGLSAGLVAFAVGSLLLLVLALFPSSRARS